MADGLLLFGKIALKNKLITEAQLEEALGLQQEARKIGLQENLGTICIRLGYLSPESVDKILEVQLRKEIRDTSHLYGRIALQNNMINQQKLNEALKLQEEQKFRAPVGQYLLKLGHISFKDHQGVLQVIERIQKTQKKSGENSAAAISAQIAEKKEDIKRDQEEIRVVMEKTSRMAAVPKVEVPPPRAPSLESDLANLIPGYTLEKKLGQGAMGVVYKALQTSLGKEVAIKILPPDFSRDDQRVERFIREARALGKLNHPNIIKALDMGKVGDYVYYAMEYIRGKTLDKIIRKHLIIPEKTALEITRDIGSALSHASKNSIIHRDIKPENIMISKDGTVKLCDLGLAKSLSNRKSAIRLTMDGTTVGTPLYMSPEQAKGEAVDVRTDIYALGVTLFEMVTGKPPYIHKSPIIVMQMHLMEPIPLAREKNSEVSESTSNLIEDMMEKDLGDRIGSPDEVVAIIDDILAGRPYPEEKETPSKGFFGLRKKRKKKNFRRRL